MATTRSMVVVRAGLSGAFDETIPEISSGGTYNQQGMPFSRASTPGDAGTSSSLITSDTTDASLSRVL